MLRPFTRLQRLILSFKEPVGVYILNENTDLKESLPVLRRNFRGTWYYLYNRFFKIRGQLHIVYPSIRDVSWVRKIKLNVIPIRSFKKQKNVIFDLTPLFQIVRSKVKPMHVLWKNIIESYFSIFRNRKNILLYVVDLHNKSLSYRFTYLYQILYFAIKHRNDEEFLSKLPQNIVISAISGNKTFFIPIIVEGDYSNASRALSFLRRIINMIKDTGSKIDDKSEIEIELSNEEVGIDKETISQAVISSQINSIRRQKEQYGNINTTHLLYSLANKIIPNSVKTDFVPTQFSKVKTSLSSLVPTQTIKGNNTSVISRILKGQTLPNPVNNTIDNFSKIESEKVVDNLKKILSAYENSDLKLKIIDTKIQDVPVKKNEISPSNLYKVTIKLSDKFGKIHTINMLLPKLNKDNMYYVYGNKYTVVKQIYPLPITFPKPWVGRYASYTITFLMKKTVKIPTSVYISGTTIPIGIILSYYFGFENILERYKIKWSIEETPNKDKDILDIKLKDKKYIWIHNVNNLSELQKDLIDSIFKFKNIDQIESENILSKEWFIKFLELYTGVDNIHERITYLLNISIDKRTFEILKEKGFPTTLLDIFLFMHEKIIQKYVTPRNSLIESRIRGHEALSQITFDVLRKSFSSYLYQVKRGNKNAKIVVNPESVLSAIITSSSFQLAEYTNPIEELMQHYKVTYSGYNGIPKEGVTDQIRSIHPSAFGVIDPIDVPLGSNVGVVQHFTMNQILTVNGGIIPKEISDNVGSNILSFATASIPFISRNEPTRAMMASNQSKQATVLLEADVPIVQTGVESIVPTLLKSDVFLIKSPCDGIINNITKDTIEVKSKDGKTCKLDISWKFARSGQGYSGYIEHKPIVKKGQKVREGDILTNSNAVKNGITAYGKNLVTAYMFWKGYTYEDGVVISESASKQLTSVHVIKVSTFIDEQDRIIQISDKIKKGNKVEAGDILVKVLGSKFQDMIETGLINEEDIIVVGNKYQLVAPYDAEILDYKFYLSGIDITRFDSNIQQKLKELNVISSTEYFYKGKKYKGALIEILFKVTKPMVVGDKLTNRAASKGIVCNILPDKEMPQLQDGRHVELIINPMSFINRTNVGQLFELYCGEIGYQLMIHMQKLSRSKFLQLLGKVMINLDKNFYGSAVYNYLSRCSDQDYKNFLKFAVDNRGFPIVIVPFQEPSYKDILKAMNILKIPTKQKAKFDGKIKEIRVGMQYILKLEHIASHKIQGRSIGPYQMKTGQPTQGKARGGGQRLGEGDVLSLFSWDAENLAKELLSGVSDDFRLKQQMYRQIIETGSTSIELLKEGEQQSKQYVKYLLRGAMIEL